METDANEEKAGASSGALSLPAHHSNTPEKKRLLERKSSASVNRMFGRTTSSEAKAPNERRDGTSAEQLTAIQNRLAKRFQRRDEYSPERRRVDEANGTHLIHTPNDGMLRSSDLPKRRRSSSRLLSRLVSQQKKDAQSCATAESEKRFRIQQCFPDLRDNPNRILDISDMEPRVRNSSLAPGELLFEPDPQVVFFVDFELFKTYECVLRLRNRDSFARRVQVLQPDTRAFVILPGKGGIGPASPKVAPGMTTCFTVQFTPDAREDYISELVVVTEREKFIVPLRAICGIGFLDLPPSVAFNPTPVKVKGEKTILLRNTGTKAMVFTIHTTPPFSAVSTRCFLDVGDSTQVTFSFEPARVSTYSSVALLRTTEGLEFSTDLIGKGVNADVKLSAAFLKMENTSVALIHEKTVHLHNNSDHHLDFCWSLLTDDSRTEFDQTSDAVTPRKNGSCEDETLLVPTSTQPGDWQEDPVFQIFPSEGRVWANTSLVFKVVFRPALALRYRRIATCAIAGREAPLSLELEGTGTGPKAQFLETDVDLGPIVVHTETTMENELMNQGDIGATFSLRKSTSLAQSMFSFTPEGGHLAVGETVKIKTRFHARALGTFEETFHWWINDLPQPLQTTFRGEVLPPVLKLDPSSIDFGRLALGFSETRRVTLKNASSAPQPFRLRLEAAQQESETGTQENEVEKTEAKQEFGIHPVEGILEARGTQEVALVLTPAKAQAYNTHLIVDLGSLAPQLLSVPVKATCELPTLTFESDDILHFGDVFVGHAYSQKIFIRNPSALPARYEVSVQEIEAGQVTLHVEEGAGAIEGLERRSVSVHLCAKTTGSVAASLSLSVVGGKEPTSLRLRATSCGPRVRAEPKELDWGKVPCLEEAPRCVKVTNTCPIPAEVTCALRGKEGCFRLNRHLLTLAPGASEILEVTAAFQEPVQQQELLVLSVADGAEIPVTLRGLGTQTPVVFSRDLTLVDFGMFYTGQLKSFKFTAANRGRRARKLSWVDACRAEKQLHLTENAFTVVPETVVLEPNASAAFEYKALSQAPGHLVHAFVCTELSGIGAKSVPILKSTAKADVYLPSLSFSSNTVSFRYIWREGDSGDHLTQDILCTNETPLPAICSFKAAPPFSVSPSKLNMKEKGTGTLTVTFDPAFNGRVCSKIKEKLEATYDGHAKTESVELRAEVVYPAVEIDTKEVDFGCIFNETSRRLAITLRNPTELPVVYHWYLTPHYDFRYVSGDNDVPLALVNTAAPPPINKVFDFLPFTGSIEPGESETICATFFGVPDVRVTATALCVIENGPEFSLSLKGQASLPTFRLSQTEFDFGEVPYNRAAESELTIHNTGLVDVQFFVDLSKLDFPWLVDVSKRAGKIPSRDKQKLTIRFRPGMPMEFRQKLYLEIGPFEPVPLFIRGIGIFASLSLNLPRRDESNHQRKKTEMLQRLSTAERAVRGEGEEMRLARLRRPELSLEEQAEREVDRLEICQYLHAQYLSLLDKSLSGEKGKKSSDPSVGDSWALPERQSSNASFSSTGEAWGTKAKAVLEGVRVTAGQYVCDFGNIVVGQSRKKTIRIANLSSAPISLRTNQRTVATLGFAVEPGSILRLGPGEETTLSVSTACDKEGAAAGTLQLQTAEGPVYSIHLQASFVIPDLTISTDKVDFGTVKRGQRKTIYVRFRNAVAVPVDWRLRDRIDKHKPQASVQAFGVEPTQGTLNPGEFVDVKLYYYAESSEKETTTKLFFQVEDNPRWKSISLRGRTQVTQLSVSPSGLLEFQCCLPHQPVKREISIVNLSGSPCEVCAVDFDEQHKLFEYVLRDYPDFDDKGFAFLPVRKPGKPFWRRVLRRALQCVRQDSSDQQLQLVATEIGGDAAGDASAQGVPGQVAEVATTEKGFAFATTAQEVAHASTSGAAPTVKESQSRHGEESTHATPCSRWPGAALPTLQRLPTEATLCECIEPENVEWSESESEPEATDVPFRVPTEKRVNALVVGPACVGKTSVAHFLAKESRRKLLTIDDCLDWVVAAERQKQRRLKDDEAFSSLATSVRKALAANREAENEQPRRGNRGKKTEARTHPSEPRASLSPELLAACVRYRTAMPDCFAGSVFDGCSSALVNVEPPVIAHCVAEALAQEQLVLISIKFGDPQTDVERRASSPALSDEAIACGVQFYKHLSAVLQEQEKRFQDQLETQASEGQGRGETGRRGRLGQTTSDGGCASSETPGASSTSVDDAGSGLSALHGRGREGAVSRDVSANERDVEDLKGVLAGVQALRQKLEAVVSGKTAHLYVAEQIAFADKIENALFSPERFESHFVLVEEASRASDVGDELEVKEASQLSSCRLPPSSVLAQEATDGTQNSSPVDKQSSRSRPTPNATSSSSSCSSFPSSSSSSSSSHSTSAASSSSASASSSSSSTSSSSSSSALASSEPGRAKRQGARKDRTSPRSSGAVPSHGEKGRTSLSMSTRLASLSSVSTAVVPTASPRRVPTLFRLMASAAKSLAEMREAAGRQLPAPEIPSEPPIPSPELHEIARRPPVASASPQSGAQTQKHPPPVNFSLFIPIVPGPEEGGVPGQAVDVSPEVGDSKGSKGLARKTKDSPAPRSRVRADKREEASSAVAKSLESEPAHMRATRWVLGPHEEQRVLVKFCVDQTGVYETGLAFSVVGDSQSLLRVGVRATCSVPKLSMSPKQLFRQVLRARPSEREGLVCKQFIVDEGVYDFGPLLLGRPSAPAKGLYSKLGDGDSVDAVKLPEDLQKYQESITLCNISPFDTTVRCTLQSASPAPDSAGGVSGDHTGRKKGASKGALIRENPFFVYPSEVSLEGNSCSTVHLWCFPKTEGDVRDTLVLWVRDNPTPAEIPLVARGALPKVTVDADYLQFGRVLFGHSVSRALSLKNASPLPARWSLLNVDALQKLFKVGPDTEGTLEAFEELQLLFTFSPTQKAASLQTRVSIRITDVDGTGQAQETKTISVDADAYWIDVATDFGGKGKTIDIGNVRVGETAELPLSITNKGKFPVKFAFRVKSKVLRSILTFHGPTADLAPGEHRRMSLRCSPQREMDFCEAEEVFLDLQDAESGAVLNPALPPFPLSLHADFNYVSLLPARGINFGPTESGKTHSLQFEVLNDGRFPFEWLLQDADQLSRLCSATVENAGKALTEAESPVPALGPSPKETRARAGDRSGAAAGGASKAGAPGKSSKSPGTRQMSSFAQWGPFRLSPVKGQLEPGGKVTVDVQYSAQGDANHSLKLALLVQGVKVERGEEVVISNVGCLGALTAEGGEGTGDAKGEKALREVLSGCSGPLIPAAEYIIQAQSCVPAIVTDPEWVFEEQFLVSNAEEAAVWNGLRTTPMYLLEEKCLLFGSVTPNSDVNKAGIQAQIRIGNPKSVPAAVSLEIKLSKDTDKSLLTTDSESVFEVQPKHLSLGPHETKTATLTFHPSALQRYAAAFRAFVNRSAADGGNAALAFDVRGEGTLPTVSLEVAPSDAAGSAHASGEKSFFPSIAMGKVAVGTTATAVCLLKNYGTIAATARCEWPAADGITVELPPAVTLNPGDSKTFAVHLVAQAPGEIDSSFRIYTVSNPYEDVTCRVRGTCYLEECRWSTSPSRSSGLTPPTCLQGSPGPLNATSGVRGSPSAAAGTGVSLGERTAVSFDAALSPRLPERQGDQPASTVDFGDVAPDDRVSRTLFFENTTDSFMKFEVVSPLPPDLRKVLQISPIAGFLAPRGAQEVTLVFTSKEPVAVSAVCVPCRAWRLKASSSTAAAAVAKTKSRAKSAASVQDSEGIEEHDGQFYQMENGREIDLPLFISARCDTRQCELECQDIVFESTMMFKSKEFVFTLTNPAKVTLPFEFRWEDTDALLDNPSFYVLSPSKGVVPPSSKMDISLEFTPTELAVFKRFLVCSFPSLPYGEETRKMTVDATAVRPICHFDLPPSDYRDRREQTNLPALDPKIQVVEIVSVGIGVKNTKRFFVLNPSSSDLDFEWEPLSSDSAPHSLKADAGGLASSQACRDRVASARCASPGAGTPRRTGFLPPVEGVRCVNLRGRIAAGRKTEVVLEFLPNKPKTQERLWKFCIPSRKLEQLFLFVGRVKEPHVALDCSSVCFNPVLLGGKVEEVVNIHNKEDIPLSFAFSRKQAESEKSPLPPCLVVSPRHGVLPPNSVTPVRLRFKPEDEKPFKCSLLCRVRQKVRPLSLGVRGAGYSVKHSMVLLNEDGSIRQFASGSQSASLLDFGPLLLGQTRRYLLQLQNAGSFDFRFHWSIQSVSTVSCSPSLSVSPTEGVVETGRNCEVTLTYAPAEISKHEEYLLLCSISGSDPYRIRAQGSCSSPKVSFSFSSHDFGAFVLPPSLFPDLGSVVALSSPSSGGSAISDRVELKITNLDPHHDCFISTPFEKSNVLDVQLVPCSIGPGEKISVTLVFAPKQAKNYRFKIPFSINDRTTAHVTVTGKGIPARLELSPSSDEIRFAPLIKGESAVKHVRIVNRTEASLEFFLPASPNLSSRGISWKPLSSETKPFSLHPRQELPLEVSFKPALSIPEFSLPLFAECLVKRGGLTYRFPSLLCHIAAKSFETEVRLSQPSLAFGPIVVNSWATQIVKLTNIGELFMHFKFKTSTKYSQMVSLSPSEGLLHPHADVPIEVTFRPTEVTQKRIVVDDIICLIKASGASASNVETSSLSLTVTGQGVAQPSDSVQTLQFSTAVRTQQTKTFQVKNSKKYDWSTTPLVACESPKDAMYFLCSPSGRVTIPANQKVTFQVTYSPLTMTRASSSVREGTLSAEEVDGVNRKEQRERGDGACNGHLADKDNHPRLPLFHAASVFIPLPDGEAATCRFIGQATEPTVEQVVDASIVCREKQIQAIKIRNWIPVKQKFDVAYTITQCTGDTPPQIQAPDRFELPASQAREYRFLASAFKPCAAVVQFRFTSREKADFYLAEARLTFTDPETVGTIALETTVRQLAKTKVLVENPSTRKAVFQCQSNVADVCFSPSPLEVPPGATGALEVSLRANVSGAGEGTIVLTSDELGTYKYLLKYSVSAGEIEKHATFSAPLGKEVSETLRFLHFAKKPTTYLATIDFAPDETRGGGRSKASGSVENFFLENKSVAVSGDVENRGTEFAVGVRFAPSKLAETKATLVLRSAEGFEYKALLIGRAQPPQPQGPFRLGKGKCINIDFRNPFETQTEFSLQVDRPCFSVEKKVVKLEARKSTTISVQVKPDARDAGRLIVTADGIPPWIFYLKAD